MSITLMGKIFKLENVLTSSEKFVLLSLADHGNDDGLSIYPSISLTAQRTSLDERSVRRIQNTLADKGFLVITHNSNGNQTNNYKIDVTFIDQILSGQKPLPLAKARHTPDSMSSPPGLYALPPLTLCPPTPDTESSESLINHKRITMINHEEEEEESSPKLSSSASSEIDWEVDLPIPVSPLAAENHPVINLFILATGRIPGIEDYSLVIDTLRMLRKRFLSDQALVDYIEPFWISWQGRKAKSGHNYRLSSLVWLTEWAVNNDIPKSKNSDCPKSNDYSTYRNFETGDSTKQELPLEEDEESEELHPPTPGEKLIQQLVDIHRNKFGPNSILEGMLDDCQVRIDNDNQVSFYTADQYSADLLRERLGKTIKRDLVGILNKPSISVTFICDDKLALGAPQ
jgi:hypothetical protein